MDLHPYGKVLLCGNIGWPWFPSVKYEICEIKTAVLEDKEILHLL